MTEDDDFFGPAPTHGDECDGAPVVPVTDEVEKTSWWLCKCGKRVAPPDGP